MFCCEIFVYTHKHEYVKRDGVHMLPLLK